MTTDYDVVIAGAGPVGPWLAGVRTAVLERLETPNPDPKALGIQPRTLEVFAMRGIEQRFLAEGIPLPKWHFGFLGDVILDDPPPIGATFYNGYGAVLTAPMPGGLVRVSGYDATDQVPGRREVTFDELRATAIRIAGQPSVSLELAKKLTGLDIHYPAAAADAHPLVGGRVSGVEQYLHSGRAVLLNKSEQPLESAGDDATAAGIATVVAAASSVRPPRPSCGPTATSGGPRTARTPTRRSRPRWPNWARPSDTDRAQPTFG
jgi:hypothetical protein